MNDSLLLNAQRKAIEFIAAVRRDPYGRGYGLSFLGNNGTGKTMLARAILEALGKSPGGNLTKIPMQIRAGSVLDRTGRLVNCRRASQMMLDGAWKWLDGIGEHLVVVFDDLGADYDKSGAVTAKFDLALREREGKWWVLTSNIFLREMTEHLDPRIGSWLVRDRNVVVELDCEDYATRTAGMTGEER